MTFVWRLLGRERKRFGLQRVIERINLPTAPAQKRFRLSVGLKKSRSRVFVVGIAAGLAA
jgi:hypothetical protein